MSATIDELIVADEPATWAALGFAIEHDVCVLRPAVQPGRRIATLRRSARLGVPVALMTGD